MAKSKYTWGLVESKCPECGNPYYPLPPLDEEIDGEPPELIQKIEDIECDACGHKYTATTTIKLLEVEG